MLPPIPSHYTLGDTVPLHETSQIEFKENSISFEKLKKTVCAFLNTIGGYIFIGINDSRIITGITYHLADRFSLFVDQLISGKGIMRTDGTDLTISEVSTRVQEVEGSRGSLVILIIAIRPASTEQDYMWSTGERYFRLNASNYCRRSDASEIVQLKERIALLKSDCGKLNSHIDMMSGALRKSMVAAAKAAAERDDAVQALHRRILADKAAAEKALQASSGLFWFLCCLA